MQGTRVLLNVAIFYAAWFGTVMAAARGWPEVAIGLCLLGLVIHFRLTAADLRRREIVIVTVCVGIGLIVEGALLAARLTAFPAGTLGDILGTGVPATLPLWLPPLWLIGLWALFGTLINVSLAPLQGRLAAAAALAAAGGPASYYAGQRLGAITLAEPLPWTLFVIAVTWAAAFAAILVCARWLNNGMRSRDRTA